MSRITQGRSYAKFYTLLSRLPYDGPRTCLKEQIVNEFTGGRTVHLHQMTDDEYAQACRRMAELIDQREDIRRLRSACLKLMQLIGIDTTDWTRINAFCQDARIAGKPFRWLDSGDLRALSDKLRAIDSRGGLKPKKKRDGSLVYVFNNNNSMA